MDFFCNEHEQNTKIERKVLKCAEGILGIKWGKFPGKVYVETENLHGKVTTSTTLSSSFTKVIHPYPSLWREDYYNLNDYHCHPVLWVVNFSEYI